MCFKTSFSKPPNLLPKTEIQEKLVEGIKNRFNSLEEINDEIAKIDLKKDSTFQKLIKIFSNS